MTGDAELLRQYVQAGSEDAFAELVQRHLPVVYSSALRQTGGDVELAKDICQTVFIDLGRKAGSLLGHELLVGWLFSATRFAAATVLRANRRRQMRERIAVSMHEDAATPALECRDPKLASALDAALEELTSEDRNAVLLRFFQGKDFQDVGGALGISEDAARMRVTRAIGKLHSLLERRGVTVSAAALGSILATEAVTAVPAGLAATISTAALAGIPPATTTTAILAKAMAMTTLNKTLIIAIVVVLAGVGIYEARQAMPTVRLGASRVNPQIAVCADRVVLLAPDGSLWTWGRSRGKITKPHRLGTDSDWKTVAGSASAVIATKTNGSLWRFDAFQTPPRQLYPGTAWLAVAASQKEMAALTTDGAIWAAREPPVQLGQETNWLAVAGGFLHMAAVRADGSLWVWGQFDPRGAALGLTRFGNESNWSEVCSAGFDLMARKRDGTCWMGGSSGPWLTNLLALQRPLDWGEVTRVKQIEDWHSVTFGAWALGLGHDGTLRGFGPNYGRVLGSGPSGVRKGPVQIGKRRDWVAVGADGWAAVGLTADGTVWAWGKRVDKVEFRAKIKQRLAPVLGRLGIQINTAARDVISSQPTPILRFRLQLLGEGLHREPVAASSANE